MQAAPDLRGWTDLVVGTLPGYTITLSDTNAGAIFLRRRMSPIWRTFEAGLVLSCRRTYVARNVHRISLRLTNHARQRYRTAVQSPRLVAAVAGLFGRKPQ